MGESGPSARPIVGLERAQRGPRYTGSIKAFGGAIGFRLGLREPGWGSDYAFAHVLRGKKASLVEKAVSRRLQARSR